MDDVADEELFYQVKFVYAQDTATKHSLIV